jgi:hypothetical protein
VHDIMSDIIDWDQANKAHMAGEGQSGERYIQRLEAAGQMTEIEARWDYLPEGFPAPEHTLAASLATADEVGAEP